MLSIYHEFDIDLHNSRGVAFCLAEGQTSGDFLGSAGIPSRYEWKDLASQPQTLGNTIL